MAIVDVVKWDVYDGEYCYKFPSDDLRIGTQLVVYPSQTAFFMKGGDICDEFEAGTYTLKSENLPILNKIINIPFGNDSPFKAEVWFINRLSKLDMPWGTPQPIQLEDPKYKIIVPVRAYGQYGLKVNNPKIFIETLIGNMKSFTTDKIDQYFKGRIVSILNNLLAKVIIEEGTSVLDINTRLVDMSDNCNHQLNERVKHYGIEIIEFTISSINIPQNDQSVVKLKKAKDLAARINITGRDVYQMERSFDVLDKAASNESAGGQMVGLGAGLGAGLGVGSTVGNITGQSLNISPPPLQQEKTYYIYIDNKQIGGQTISTITSLIHAGKVDGNTLVWTVGMQNWLPISQVTELASLFSQQTPPPLK